MLESQSVCESHHLTSLIHRSTLQLLRAVALCSGLYADNAQKDVVATLAGLLRLTVQAGCKPETSKWGWIVSDEGEREGVMRSSTVIDSIGFSDTISLSLLLVQSFELILDVIKD